MSASVKMKNPIILGVLVCFKLIGTPLCNGQEDGSYIDAADGNTYYFEEGEYYLLSSEEDANGDVEYWYDTNSPLDSIPDQNTAINAINDSENNSNNEVTQSTDSLTEEDTGLVDDDDVALQATESSDDDNSEAIESSSYENQLDPSPGDGSNINDTDNSLDNGDGQSNPINSTGDNTDNEGTQEDGSYINDSIGNTYYFVDGEYYLLIPEEDANGDVQYWYDINYPLDSIPDQNTAINDSENNSDNEVAQSTDSLTEEDTGLVDNDEESLQATESSDDDNSEIIESSSDENQLDPFPGDDSIFNDTVKGLGNGDSQSNPINSSGDNTDNEGTQDDGSYINDGIGNTYYFTDGEYHLLNSKEDANGDVKYWYDTNYPLESVPDQDAAINDPKNNSDNEETQNPDSLKDEDTGLVTDDEKSMQATESSDSDNSEIIEPSSNENQLYSSPGDDSIFNDTVKGLDNGDSQSTPKNSTGDNTDNEGTQEDGSYINDSIGNTYYFTDGEYHLLNSKEDANGDVKYWYDTNYPLDSIPDQDAAINESIDNSNNEETRSKDYLMVEETGLVTDDEESMKATELSDDDNSEAIETSNENQSNSSIGYNSIFNDTDKGLGNGDNRSTPINSTRDNTDNEGTQEDGSYINDSIGNTYYLIDGEYYLLNSDEDANGDVKYWYDTNYPLESIPDKYAAINDPNNNSDNEKTQNQDSLKDEDTGLVTDDEKSMQATESSVSDNSEIIESSSIENQLDPSLGDDSIANDTDKGLDNGDSQSNSINLTGDNTDNEGTQEDGSYINDSVGNTYYFTHGEYYLLNSEEDANGDVQYWYDTNYPLDSIPDQNTAINDSEDNSDNEGTQSTDSLPVEDTVQVSDDKESLQLTESSDDDNSETIETSSYENQLDTSAGDDNNFNDTYGLGNSDDQITQINSTGDNTDNEETQDDGSYINDANGNIYYFIDGDYYLLNSEEDTNGDVQYSYDTDYPLDSIPDQDTAKVDSEDNSDNEETQSPDYLTVEETVLVNDDEESLQATDSSDDDNSEAIGTSGNEIQLDSSLGDDSIFNEVSETSSDDYLLVPPLDDGNYLNETQQLSESIEYQSSTINDIDEKSDVEESQSADPQTEDETALVVDGSQLCLLQGDGDVQVGFNEENRLNNTAEAVGYVVDQSFVINSTMEEQNTSESSNDESITGINYYNVLNYSEESSAIGEDQSLIVNVNISTVIGNNINNSLVEEIVPYTSLSSNGVAIISDTKSNATDITSIKNTTNINTSTNSVWCTSNTEYLPVNCGKSANKYSDYFKNEICAAAKYKHPYCYKRNYHSPTDFTKFVPRLQTTLQRPTVYQNPPLYVTFLPRTMQSLDIDNICYTTVPLTYGYHQTFVSTVYSNGHNVVDTFISTEDSNGAIRSSSSHCILRDVQIEHFSGNLYQCDDTSVVNRYLLYGDCLRQTMHVKTSVLGLSQVPRPTPVRCLQRIAQTVSTYGFAHQEYVALPMRRPSKCFVNGACNSIQNFNVVHFLTGNGLML